jgi:thiol-disulfide isomerase/thioredoxin
MLRIMIGFVFSVVSFIAQAQDEEKLQNGNWGAGLLRPDGHSIVFNFEVKQAGSKKFLYLRNAAESLKVDDIHVQGDSIWIRLPFFDSRVRAVFKGNNRLEGLWIKTLKDRDQQMPFAANFDQHFRFPSESGPARVNVTGRWAVTFRGPSGRDSTPAVGEFVQKGDHVTGTFLHPTGDYRYLEGIVTGDSLKLSCFDGGHAYLFNAGIAGNRILSGIHFSGPLYKEIWTARRDETARLPDEFSLTKMKPGQTRLDFSFRDINGKMVSIHDNRFHNKVILIQIMGSWCPNCMDETHFLSRFYDQYRTKGVEIIALAYERSTDFTRSQKSLRACQQRFDVKYPILITGVTDSDSLQTEKTLPQLEKIEGFPATIFISKSGEVAKIHTGFNGPATGEHYLEEQKTFTKIVDELLAR